MPEIPIKVLQDIVKLEELCEVVAKLQKQVKYLQAKNIDSDNVFEVGGWRVGPDQIASTDGDVGMSTADTGGDDIRFFAGPDGSLYLWYVTKSGEMVAQRAMIKGHIDAESGTIGGFTIELDKISSDSGEGIIEGGTIRTAAPNNQRIELANGSFKGYTADNKLSGLVFDPNTVNDIVDLLLYHRGTKLVEFYDDITQYKIRGAAGATGFRLGGNGVTTFAEGPWSFSSASVSGISQSSITGLESRLSSIEARLTALETAP